MDENLLDDIIRRLLETNNGKAAKQQVKLLEAEIRQLCYASKEVFLSQPNLLELEAPIKICGILITQQRYILSIFYMFISAFFSSCVVGSW